MVRWLEMSLCHCPSICRRARPFQRRIAELFQQERGQIRDLSKRNATYSHLFTNLNYLALLKTSYGLNQVERIIWPDIIFSVSFQTSRFSLTESIYSFWLQIHDKDTRSFDCSPAMRIIGPTAKSGLDHVTSFNISKSRLD